MYYTSVNWSNVIFTFFMLSMLILVPLFIFFSIQNAIQKRKRKRLQQEQLNQKERELDAMKQ